MISGFDSLKFTVDSYTPPFFDAPPGDASTSEPELNDTYRAILSTFISIAAINEHIVSYLKYHPLHFSLRRGTLNATPLSISGRTTLLKRQVNELFFFVRNAGEKKILVIDLASRCALRYLSIPNEMPSDHLNLLARKGSVWFKGSSQGDGFLLTTWEEREGSFVKQKPELRVDSGGVPVALNYEYALDTLMVGSLSGRVALHSPTTLTMTHGPFETGVTPLVAIGIGSESDGQRLILVQDKDTIKKFTLDGEPFGNNKKLSFDGSSGYRVDTSSEHLGAVTTLVPERKDTWNRRDEDEIAGFGSWALSHKISIDQLFRCKRIDMRFDLFDTSQRRIATLTPTSAVFTIYSCGTTLLMTSFLETLFFIDLND